MIIKNADIFTPGCCLGHYNGKRKECRVECDIADVCKKLIVDGKENQCKVIMKKNEKDVLECIRIIND